MSLSLENQLKNEKSPYLLQHKDNPIAWMAWGEPAFQRAREENKPIFLSVGYSTCHWCHVMAHESFEDAQVAEVLNGGFVSVKVDREERPDVDHVYMTALQTISGGGGWPMSVWLTPDGKPFFAGTYYPKPRFLQLLARISEVWGEDPGALATDGQRLLDAIAKSEAGAGEVVTKDACREVLRAYLPHFSEFFDPVNGGFGGAPKFPQTMSLRVLMRQNPLPAREIVATTLTKMARGGIYDHLAGGFHRYSVDEEWLVPHFEKMLYDQAMIVSTLVEAWQLYGGDELRSAASETLDYVLREMTHPEGGFYSAQDADSRDPATGHNEEGYFATYTYEELRAALTPDELKALETGYGVTPAGNFEGRNILHLQSGQDRAAKDSGALAAAFAKLRTIRAARPAPHLDDKIIAAWNGWMIAALAQAGRAFHEEKYLRAARRALDFVRGQMCSSGKLSRTWRDGRAHGAANAEDYASLIHAVLEVQAVDGDRALAAWALELQGALDADFRSMEHALYLANDGGDPRLPLRLADQYDGVTPSSNSMAVYNLARLHLLTGDAQYEQRLLAVAGALFAKWKRHPSGLSYLALGLDFYCGRPRVVVTDGAGWREEFQRREDVRFLPRLTWIRAGSGWPAAEGKSGALYICEVGACLPPAATPEEAEKQIQSLQE